MGSRTEIIRTFDFQTETKEAETPARRIHVHGGKDKWNWKKGKSRPKFT